jgi:thioredoxin-related protein
VKRFLFIFLFAGIGQMAFAQADTTLLYLRFPTVPPISINKLPDSTKFTKNDLKKNTPTLVFIFSPDCEHCQHETKELIAHIDLFKKIQIVMATPLEFRFVRKFYEEYKISDHPNITIGTDPGYMLGTFFHVRSFPALYLYDKKGNFIRAFDGSVPVETIAEAL